MLGLLVVVGYVALYGAGHSLLASQRVKDWARRAGGRIVKRYYRLAYNAFALVALLPLGPLLLALPDRPLYALPMPWLPLALLGQAMALVGMALCVGLTDAWHFLGLRQVAGRAEASATGKLILSGPYRWVRHPIYSLGLVLIWLTPEMTLNRLGLAATLSAYIYVGTFFEERRLVGEFGEPYRAYQRQVPRLLPRPPRRSVDSLPSA